MKKNILLLLLLVVGIVSAKADNITVNGTSRSYNVIVPKDLGENRPLLIFCHGYNQDANWMQFNEFKNDNVSMEAVCDTAKFICVFPNGIDRAWDTGGDRDINFIKAIIDKMATQHKIDRNRIYLGGFSMGGMLTYNAINKMHDIIAAFVSCSGPSVVTPNSKTRPIPLLHIQGTADNFGGVQPALNPWIKHDGCPTTAKVVTNYNGFSGATMHTWGPGNDGVEVKLLELKDKGHWICKEPQVYTGKEIWNFCKRFSLNKTSPSVKITSPANGTKYISFAPKNEATFPDITITATADDSNGTIEKVEALYGNAHRSHSHQAHPESCSHRQRRRDELSHHRTDIAGSDIAHRFIGFQRGKLTARRLDYLRQQRASHGLQQRLFFGLPHSTVYWLIPRIQLWSLLP